MGDGEAGCAVRITKRCNGRWMWQRGTIEVVSQYRKHRLESIHNWNRFCSWVRASLRNVLIESDSGQSRWPAFHRSKAPRQGQDICLSHRFNDANTHPWLAPDLSLYPSRSSPRSPAISIIIPSLKMYSIECIYVWSAAWTYSKSCQPLIHYVTNVM